MVFSFSVTTFEMSEATEVVTTGASASTSRVKRTATTDTGTANLQRFQMLSNTRGVWQSGGAKRGPGPSQFSEQRKESRFKQGNNQGWQ